MGHAVLESDRTEQAAREQGIKRLQARYEQIQAHIETLYRDRLDGRIDAEFFDSTRGRLADHTGVIRRQEPRAPIRLIAFRLRTRLQRFGQPTSLRALCALNRFVRIY